MLNVFVSARMSPYWLEKLGEHFSVDHYDWFASGGFLPLEQMVARLQGRQVLITESDEITREIIERAPELRIIAVCRGTPVNIDLKAATERGIAVLNTPGRNADAVADLTIALMLMVARNLIPGMEAMRAGRWYAEGKRWCYINFQGSELFGKTLGLVGLGSIGRLVIKRLSGFGMEFIAYDPYVDRESAAGIGVCMVSLEELLQHSDYISLHAPLTAETRGMIGVREFEQMKPTAYLINTARAGLTEEGALIEALQSHRIAGAAIDVYHTEPVPADYPLLHMPHVVTIPHLGGATREVIDHQSQIAVEGLLSLLEGKPYNLVNSETLDTALANLRV